MDVGQDRIFRGGDIPSIQSRSISVIIEDDQRTQTASSPRQGKGEALRHQGDAETDTQGPHRSGPAGRTIAPALDCPPEVLSPLRCLDREPQGTASRRANRTVMIWELPSPSNKPTSVSYRSHRSIWMSWAGLPLRQSR